MAYYLLMNSCLYLYAAVQRCIVQAKIYRERYRLKVKNKNIRVGPGMKWRLHTYADKNTQRKTALNGIQPHKSILFIVFY